MNCPVCNVDLVLSERQGIEIDYCPKCRGIWLDRGELDKVIERSASQAPQGYAPERRGRADRPTPQGYASDHGSGFHQPAPPPYHPEQQRHDSHYGPPGHYKQKRKSLLEEIFDFD